MNLRTGTHGLVQTPEHASLLLTPRLPSSDVRNRLWEQGYPVFQVFEVRRGLEPASRFRDAVEQARESQGPWGPCLDLHSVADYSAMRLFVDATWQAGFAMRSRELVSGFNHRNNPLRNVLTNLMEVAISLGGDRCNAFDTVLPSLYAQSGFEEVARLSWCDEEAPQDWDYNATCEFNGGRPDVAFMVHQPGHFVSQRVQSYAEGLDIQERALALKGGQILE